MGASQSQTVFSTLVTRLKDGVIEEADSAFWDEFWKTTLTADEIFQLLAVDTVRDTVEHRRSNMVTLFTQAVAQLYQVVETPYPVYFDQALNCSRVLARVVPLLLEKEDKSIRDMFWSRQVAPMRGSLGEEDGGDVLSGNEVQDSEPLAVILINAIFHLLFLPEFTIPDPNIDFNEADINGEKFKSTLMWAAGVGSAEKSIAVASQYDANRVEILRLMVACFSDSLYQSPDKYDSCASMWLEVATSAETPFAEISFYSLLNTVLGYDPVGWGLPYGGALSADSARPLMEVAVQVLIILLDYGLPIRPTENDADAPAKEGARSHRKRAASGAGLPSVRADDTEALGFNVFRKFLSEIENEEQLNFMFRGFSRLLNNVHKAQNTVLPYSLMSIDIEEELMVLLWKCIEENPHFLPFLMKSCDITELVVPICFFMLDGRKDPAKLGLIYLSTFTLLKLSGDRNFGVALNRPYSLRLPVDMPLFTGTFGDLLVISLHKMIVNGSDKLAALYNCFLTIICNISPYCKYLSSISAVKLINLLQLFTSPRFFYANEGNYMYVMMLLTTMNNMIQYQYEGNVHLVYAILRRKEIFYKLARLTLPRAIRDIRQLQKQEYYKSFAGGTSTIGGAGASGSTLGEASQLGAHSVDAEVLTKMALTTSPTDLISTTLEERDIRGNVKGKGTGQGATTGDEDERLVRMSSSMSVEDRTGSFKAELSSAQKDLEQAEGFVNDDSKLDGTADIGIDSSHGGTGSEMCDSDDDDFSAVNVLTLRQSTSGGSKDLNSDEDEDNEEREDGDGDLNRGSSDCDARKDNAEEEQERAAPAAAPAQPPKPILMNERKAATASAQLKSSLSIAGKKDRFVPDKEWLDKVRSALPLGTIMRMLKNLLPLVKDMGLHKGNAALDEKQVVEFLQTTTLVGLLPVPHPIVIRKYQPNKYTSLWFSAFLWGVIFTHNQELSLFDGKGVRLFIVQSV